MCRIGQLTPAWGHVDWDERDDAVLGPVGGAAVAGGDQGGGVLEHEIGETAALLAHFRVLRAAAAGVAPVGADLGHRGRGVASLEGSGRGERDREQGEESGADHFGYVAMVV
jgi:hypothetical protein